MMTERVAFLNKFIMEPKKIGSITPSSSFLTKRLLGKLPWDTIETIAELGAGTGVFTDYISKNKKKLCQFIVIEQDLKMQENLRTKYPNFHYGAKAEKLDWLLQNYALPQVDCVVSGLPFAIFPESQRQKIMVAVNRSLKPGGIFVAFQYSLQMRKTFKEYFSELEIGFVPLNMPPAFVYFCRK